MKRLRILEDYTIFGVKNPTLLARWHKSRQDVVLRIIDEYVQGKIDDLLTLRTRPPKLTGESEQFAAGYFHDRENENKSIKDLRLD